MGFYFPKDKYGNRLSFKTLDEFVTDDNGVKLSDKLHDLGVSIDNIQVPDMNPTRVHFNDSEGVLYLYSGDKVISKTVIKADPSSSTQYPPSNVTNVYIRSGDRSLTLKWKDPSDLVMDGKTLSAWGGTKVVYKTTGYPESITDGTLLIDNKVRNMYENEGFTKSGLTNDTTYYIRFFPYSTSGVVNENIANRYTGTPNDKVVYGIKINLSDSNPTTSVTYIESATNMKPAKMDYITNTFDWGDWRGDEFFMPRPCMLKTDGTVDYYLNPNDYTKKTDGTTSDIANTSYNGNAMMEWGRNSKKIWYKIFQGSGTISIYFSNVKYDSSYVSWNFYDCNGNQINHFYTPIYNGSLYNNKLRSLSGRVPLVSKNVSEEILLATANNSGTSTGIHWYTEVFSDRLLINLLLVLLGKSLDTQTVFGHGYSKYSTPLESGTLNKKGLFYGGINGSSGVKVFGMENWWGNVRRRTAGIVSTSNIFKYKLTYGTNDNSSIEGYDESGDGYLNGNGVPSTGYISSSSSSNNNILLPSATQGTSSTYFCDYIKSVSTGTNYIAFGGPCDDSSSQDYNYQAGAFSVSANLPASKADSLTNASISYK